MSIKEAIFFTESFAHLQGRERELLPIVDAARAEHVELLSLLSQATYFMTFDKGSAYVSVGYMEKQDALRKKIQASLAEHLVPLLEAKHPPPPAERAEPA